MVMRYKDHDFQYEMENSDAVAGDDEQRSLRKQYRRGRPARAARRTASKANASSPPVTGMAHRRKRRWTW
jgi:hypothetical protein